MKRLLTIKEVAKVLNVSEITIRRHVKEGLPFMKIGRDFRFDLDAVMKYYQNKR